MSPQTLGALYQEGATMLCAAQVPEPDYDARALLAHVLELRPNDLLLRQSEAVEAVTGRVYHHLLALRARRLPLQYVTRSTHFCDLQLRTDDRALIPRPDTELLVESVAELLGPLQPGAADSVVDLGCGSGAIGLSLAARMPLVHLIMTDVSPAALELAAENTARQGFEERVTLLQGVYLDPIHAAGLSERVIALVSNPPYVRPDEMALLQPELHAEPRQALESPAADGLEAYRVLAAKALDLPRLCLLACEVGRGQARPVADLLGPLGEVEVRTDLNGIERVLIVHLR